MELVGYRSKKEEGMPTSGIFVVASDVKTGKSSFAASAPDSYVLMCEKGGGDSIEGRIHDIENLAEFREAITVVLKEPSIKTVVIDTIDEVGRWVAQDVASKYGLSHIEERKKGVDGFEVWGEFKDRMINLVNLLKNSGKLVVLLAHVKDPKVDQAGNIIEGAKIDIPTKAAAFIAYHAKMIGHTYKEFDGEKTNYYLTFQGGPLGQWGSRVDEVQDKTVLLPKENPWSAFEGLFPKTVKKTNKKNKQLQEA